MHNSLFMDDFQSQTDLNEHPPHPRLTHNQQLSVKVISTTLKLHPLQKLAEVAFITVLHNYEQLILLHDGVSVAADVPVVDSSHHFRFLERVL